MCEDNERKQNKKRDLRKNFINVSYSTIFTFWGRRPLYVESRDQNVKTCMYNINLYTYLY